MLVGLLLDVKIDSKRKQVSLPLLFIGKNILFAYLGRIKEKKGKKEKRQKS